MLNNGHTVQVNAETGSSLKAGAGTYWLVQYHVHTPSEGQIQGKAFGMSLRPSNMPMGPVRPRW